MTSPTVSIIIPTYNRAPLLPRALDSVIAQTFTDWEIILVDDGSADRTDAVAVEYSKRLGERFVCIRQENQGSSAARNRGIAAARGSYVAFLDSDDEFLPTKFRRQLDLFERRPHLGLVYSDYAYVDLSGATHSSVFDTKLHLARSVPSIEVEPGLNMCEGTLFDTLIRGYFVATIVGMVRREVLASDIRFDTQIAYAEEWLFYLNVARRTAAGFVDEPLSLHHFVQDSLARSDKRRNAVRYLQVLLAIRDNFDNLTHPQRSFLEAQLAAACRQLGYDSQADGDHGAAARYFAQACAYRQSPANLVRAATATGRAVFGGCGKHDPAAKSAVSTSQAAV